MMSKGKLLFAVFGRLDSVLVTVEDAFIVKEGIVTCTDTTSKIGPRVRSTVPSGGAQHGPLMSTDRTDYRLNNVNRQHETPGLRTGLIERD